MALQYNKDLLNSLMGSNRDRDPNLVSKKMPYEEENICKLYLAKFCPSFLFTNTKADIGHCNLVHDEHIKQEYEKSRDYKKLGFEEEFYVYCQHLIEDVDRKIMRGRARIRPSEARQIKADSVFRGSNHEEISKLKCKQKELIKEIERLANESKVEEAHELSEKVDELSREIEVKERESKPHSWRQTADIAVIQEQRMDVCDICGAYLVLGSSASNNRLDDHRIGKQHKGYARIREVLRDMMAERSGKTEESRRRRSRYDRGRSRSRDRSKSRSHRRSSKESRKDEQPSKDRSKSPTNKSGDFAKKAEGGGQPESKRNSERRRSSKSPSENSGRHGKFERKHRSRSPNDRNGRSHRDKNRGGRSSQSPRNRQSRTPLGSSREHSPRGQDDRRPRSPPKERNNSRHYGSRQRSRTPQDSSHQDRRGNRSRTPLHSGRGDSRYRNDHGPVDHSSKDRRGRSPSDHQSSRRSSYSTDSSRKRRRDSAEHEVADYRGSSRSPVNRGPCTPPPPPIKGMPRTPEGSPAPLSSPSSGEIRTEDENSNGSASPS